MSKQLQCGRCNKRDKVKGERYCSACRAEVMKQMRESGYLTDTCSRSQWNREQRDRSQLRTDSAGGEAERLGDGDD